MLLLSVIPSCISSRSKHYATLDVGVNNTDIAGRDNHCERIEQLVGCTGDEGLQDGYQYGSARSRCSMRLGHVRNISQVNKYNHYGDDEAGNLSNRLKINYPVDASFRKSLYIAALDRYFGLRGAASPASIRQRGKPYTFDYYFPVKQVLVKILPSHKVARFKKCTIFPDIKKIYVIDGEEDEILMRSFVGEVEIKRIPIVVWEKVKKLGGYVYFNDSLWIPVGERKVHPQRPEWVELSPIQYDLGFESGSHHDDV